MTFSRVLVPLDGSSLAFRALEFLIELPRAKDLEYVLIEVVQPKGGRKRAEERLRTKAESVLRQLRNGGDFAALARQYSDGPSAETGGLLGTFQPGELLPGFEEAAAQLQPGQISDVVRTRIGFHIIRLEARQAAGMKPFAEVQEELKLEILRDKTERKYQEWLESLRQQAYIKILYEG